MCAIASVVESGLYPFGCKAEKRVAHAQRWIRDIRLSFEHGFAGWAEHGDNGFHLLFGYGGIHAESALTGFRIGHLGQRLMMAGAATRDFGELGGRSFEGG